MSAYLAYEGFLSVTPHFSKEEVTFFNDWQALLLEVIEEGKEAKSGDKIDRFLGLELTEAQRWTIAFCSSPMIHFQADGIRVAGYHSKGQFREALLAYQHFFIGDTPVLRDAMFKDLKFIHSHTFTGVIDSFKRDYQYGERTWLYVVTPDDIYSVEGCTREEYLAHPEKYPKQFKIDTCQEKLDRYFPPLYQYAQIAKAVYENDKDKPEKKRNKI